MGTGYEHNEQVISSALGQSMTGIAAPLLMAAFGSRLASGLGHWLAESFYMFWETLWALVLGFGLSGAIQAFVSPKAMESKLGDHRPGSITRAALFGMASSSCSYAASAMARSLFRKGADFTTSMVFMFASTNLVIELGLVMVVLMGWQFMAGEFVGGTIMIVLLALAGAVLLKDARQKTAIHETGTGALSSSQVAQEDHCCGSGDSKMDAAEHAGHAGHAGHAEHAEHAGHAMPMHEHAAPATDRQSDPRTAAGWADASSFAISDLKMLRKEMLIGYLVAGLLATAVPSRWWQVIFLHGHGFLTSVENALVGPLIAMISFVCSIGNVPLAAALWKGGISFGGVASFIFADLISLPLVLIYRKFYGTRLTLRLVAIFWLVMSAAGLITGEIFSAANLVPVMKPSRILARHWSWDYTAFLDIAFLLLFGAIFWAYRNRDRLGGGKGYAIDPVCSMQVDTSKAPAHARIGKSDYWFCSDRCRERFVADPQSFLSTPKQSQ